MSSPLLDYPLARQFAAGTHRLCTCRESPQWPLCDQSQTRCDDKAYVFELSKAKFVWICQCERSQTLPFCDGEGHLK